MACERQCRQEIFTGLSCVWVAHFCLAKVSSWIFGNGTAKSLFIVLATEPALCGCTAISDCITSTIFTSLALVLLRKVFFDSKVYLEIRTVRSFDPFLFNIATLRLPGLELRPCHLTARDLRFRDYYPVMMR